MGLPHRQHLNIALLMMFLTMIYSFPRKNALFQIFSKAENKEGYQMKMKTR